MLRAFLKLFVILAGIGMTAAAAQTAPVGSLVSVEGRAFVLRGADRLTAATNVAVYSGDRIQTSGNGVVQLLFRDDTKIVVGPSSDLDLTKIEMRRNERAKSFAVNAAGGTFRFLTGRSNKRVYDLSTPTATMATRGTEFDFTVGRNADTALITYQGIVRICGLGSQCALTAPGCSAVRVNNGGRLTQPDSARSRSNLIQQDFPFARRQINLRPQFQTTTEACRSDDVPRVTLDRQAAASGMPKDDAPEAEAPPPHK